MGRLILAAMLAAVLPAGAQAAWRQAVSTHFIVYTQGTDAAARDAAARLERFEFVLRTITGARGPSSPVKVRVFMMDDIDAVQRTMPFGGEGVAGYYNTTRRGPFAITSRADSYGEGSGSRETLGDTRLHSQQILLHELTHHFTHQYFPAAYPVWYSEGFADYLGSTEFRANNVVAIGAPVVNRYQSLQDNDWLPVDQLLTARTYADAHGRIDLLYAEGWLLVHYLTNTKARPGQLRTYLNVINAGRPFAEAARNAFGDLGKLDAELRSYAGRGIIQELVLPFKPIDVGRIDVRALTPAEDAMVPIDIALFSGVPAGEVGRFADRVAAVAARFPDDPAALAMVVEADRLAKRPDAARVAADRWVSVAPTDGRALAAEAGCRADALVAGGVHDAARWTEIRRVYAAAIKASPDQPAMLRSFYETYREQGVTPPESAQNALFSAYTLLPQDNDLRREVAVDFEQRGMIDEAIAVIAPAAFQSVDPSELSAQEQRRRDKAKAQFKLAGDTDTDTARDILKRLQAKKADSKSKT